VGGKFVNSCLLVHVGGEFSYPFDTLPVRCSCGDERRVPVQQQLLPPHLGIHSKLQRALAPSSTRRCRCSSLKVSFMSALIVIMFSYARVRQELKAAREHERQEAARRKGK
jgi:hypothetical protein